MTKYDDEIREVESRLERNRVALRVEAENLTSTARRVAASPKGLMIAAVAGFAFGELTAPRRRRPASRETRDHSAPQAAKAIGIGGLLGSAALTFIRQRYGSPWVIANRAWHYYQMQKRSRTEAASYGRARPSSSAAMVRQLQPGRLRRHRGRACTPILGCRRCSGTAIERRMPPAEAPQSTPLALRLLHEELAGAASEFDRLPQALDSGERNGRKQDLLRAVDRYLRLEEETLFPALESRGVAQPESARSHGRVRAALERAHADSSEACLGALKRALEAHRDEQERHGWPRAAQVLGEELPFLALELEERRQRLRGAYGV